MKNLKLMTLMTAGFLALTSTAFAEKVGNGGGAWVCRENNGAIRWSELVDLFEAKNEFGLTVSQYPGQVKDIVDQIQLRVFKVNRDLYESLIPYIDHVEYLAPSPSKITYTEDALTIIEDSLYRLAPAQKRCVGGSIQYEQVVNYKNDGLILLQSEIFNSLSNSAKAALVMHEAIYAYRRESTGDDTSVNARRMVGLVFSTLSTEDLKKALEDLGESETGAVGMKFISIKPGNFMMGSPDNEAGRSTDEKQHLVTITRGFEMQATEVTQSQWAEVMGSNPSHFQKPENCPKTYKFVKNIAMCPNHPVEQVSWNDVQVFLSKLNSSQGSKHADGYFYRLPTEAEWEFAARAGTQTAYSFGNDPNQLFQYGHFSSNSGNQTQGVGKLKPNGLGLYDMHGNVCEWISDWYVADNTGLSVDPVGPAGGSSRVIRGGCWSNNAQYLRSALRSYSTPDSRYSRYSFVGFRVVRTR
jgi:formylglycine-generating enzyme required for sulfatase activity